MSGFASEPARGTCWLTTSAPRPRDAENGPPHDDARFSVQNGSVYLSVSAASYCQQVKYLASARHLAFKK
jgi:hypothetical protein